MPIIEGSGLGTPLQYAGTPVDGTTYAGIAAVGAVLIDTTNGEAYVNTGTQASPVWSNVLDTEDVTATPTELNQIDGVTAGVATASKAAVLGADKELDELHLAALYLGAGAGTLVAPTAAQLNSLIRFPGARATNVLRVAANVADGETVTIGSDVYEIDIINTDSGDDTADGSWANTTDPLTVDMTAYTGIDAVLAVGDLIRIESEYLRVTAIDGHSYTFERGACGTTAASHADATDIYISDAPGTSNIPVGLDTTLTPTAGTDALIGAINEVGTEAVTAIDIGNNEILLVADAVGAVTLSCTETLGGANNAWSASAMANGAAAAIKRQAVITRVPTDTEVALGNLHIALDFDPSAVVIAVRVTSGGAVKAWDGGYTLDSTNHLITLGNGGDTDWAATDTITVIAVE